jgi:hypothetical protein
MLGMLMCMPKGYNYACGGNTYDHGNDLPCLMLCTPLSKPLGMLL